MKERLYLLNFHHRKIMSQLKLFINNFKIFPWLPHATLHIITKKITKLIAAISFAYLFINVAIAATGSREVFISNHSPKKLEIYYSFCVPTEQSIQCIGSSAVTLPRNNAEAGKIHATITIPENKEIAAIVSVTDISVALQKGPIVFATCRTDINNINNGINTLLLEDHGGSITCKATKAN